MATTTYPRPQQGAWPASRFGALAFPWSRAQRLLLAAAIALALAFRLNALDAYSLSDDELNKVAAIEAYRSGHFEANGEHPMLMKLAMWGSVSAVEAANRYVAADHAIPVEFALRLPNTLAGAATTLAVFGVADLLFGEAVAAVASLAWALDVNVIAINRIGKEDSFLLLFFLIAVFCYERGKRVGLVDPTGAQRWFGFSGASFGLMLASKYMPHLLGIYAIFNGVTDRNPGTNKPDRLRFYGLMAAAFLIADPAILMPATWQYLAAYVHGDLLAHHGYLYRGQLYVTNVPVSPLGVPVTYYLRLFVTKVPLVVLGAAVGGVIEMFRRRHERGFVLLRILAVFLVVPYSLMAPKFLRYSLPMLTVLDVIAAVGLVSGVRWVLRKRWLSFATRVISATAAVIVFGVGISTAAPAAMPFYSEFQNGLGILIDPAAEAFPEEAYDYGVREAVAAIAATATRSAAIVSDVPTVVIHYLRRTSRTDIQSRSLSHGGMPLGVDETWLVVQEEHTTFENDLLVKQLRARERPWLEIRSGDRLALQVFRIEGRSDRIEGHCR
jgi:Dolichyl-phosphate-mannose-protein mannosyltransferase